jgi:hypothetical protein
MPETAPEHLNLLAPDGIVRVVFATAPNPQQCVELLNVTEAAKSADELVDALKALGELWGVKTEAEVTSRAKRVTVLEPDSEVKPPDQNG